MPTFTEGQIVHLKSGSPPLTVEKMDPGGSVKVVWFSLGEMHQLVLHADALELAKPDEPVPPRPEQPADAEPKLSTPTVWVDADGQPIKETEQPE